MKESDLQVDVADYLAVRYPDVLFHSDFGSGIKLTIGQAAKQKRQNGGRRAWPDMFIAEPLRKMADIQLTAVDDDGERLEAKMVIANGLFLELKKEGETLYPGPRAKKRFRSIDGKEYKTEHLMEQADVLYKLRNAGYAAEFAIGFDEATTIIDEYLERSEGVVHYYNISAFKDSGTEYYTSAASYEEAKRRKEQLEADGWKKVKIVRDRWTENLLGKS